MVISVTVCDNAWGLMKLFTGVLNNFICSKIVYGCNQRLSIHFLGFSRSFSKTSWGLNSKQNSA